MSVGLPAAEVVKANCMEWEIVWQQAPLVAALRKQIKVLTMKRNEYLRWLVVGNTFCISYHWESVRSVLYIFGRINEKSLAVVQNGMILILMKRK